MAVNIGTRFKNAWDAFQQREPPVDDLGPVSYTVRSPDKDDYFLPTGDRRSTLMQVFNRIATDVSMYRIEQARVDKTGLFMETTNNGLTNILGLDANLDECGCAFIRNLVISMFDEGVVAVVPRYTTKNPNETESYDLLTARVAKIVKWYPEHVTVNVFDDDIQRHREITYSKYSVAIIENPFFETMNKPNSTLQRLLFTLNSIDRYNKKQAAGKLNALIQLPFPLSNEKQRQQSQKRRRELEDEMRGSELGIGFIDVTEKVIQLGHPIENNLWAQAQDLTDQVFNQLGMPKTVFQGTASDQDDLNYVKNGLSPILETIAQEFTRKFISKTARTQGQRVVYFKNVFKDTPISKTSEMVEVFSRVAILSPNEIRSFYGFKPSEDPEANVLRNRNLNKSKNEDLNGTAGPMVGDETVEYTSKQN